RPFWPGIDSKRPCAMRARSLTASSRSCLDPAGRWPASTWSLVSANAAFSSKRFGERPEADSVGAGVDAASVAVAVGAAGGDEESPHAAVASDKATRQSAAKRGNAAPSITAAIVAGRRWELPEAAAR